MPPKPASSKSTAGRGRASVGKTNSSGRTSRRAEAADDRLDNAEEDDEEGDGAEEQQKTIPAELMTRLLHEFFEKDGTRITRDANAAVAKYMDIFVREAIARSAAERDGRFMEVSFAERCLLAAIAQWDLGVDGSRRD